MEGEVHGHIRAQRDRIDLSPRAAWRRQARLPIIAEPVMAGHRGHSSAHHHECQYVGYYDQVALCHAPKIPTLHPSWLGLTQPSLTHTNLRTMQSRSNHP